MVINLSTLIFCPAYNYYFRFSLCANTYMYLKLNSNGKLCDVRTALKKLYRLLQYNFSELLVIFLKVLSN